jgi:AcrR family transcriptional regulator
VDSTFQRARSAEQKQQRAQDLLDAARELALKHGARSVTLSAMAQRANVHHSAVRRYFASHHDVLLQLAEEGWHRWSDAVVDGLDGRQSSPAELVELLTATLARDPLLCDLMANVPLQLEHDVDVAKVIEFKRSTHAAITRMRDAIAAGVAGVDQAAALDVIIAANAMAATLWQATHPAAALASAMDADPTLSYLSPNDFDHTLTRLLTATVNGLRRPTTTPGKAPSPR